MVVRGDISPYELQTIHAGIRKGEVTLITAKENCGKTTMGQTHDQQTELREGDSHSRKALGRETS